MSSCASCCFFRARQGYQAVGGCEEGEEQSGRRGGRQQFLLQIQILVSCSLFSPVLSWLALDCRLCGCAGALTMPFPRRTQRLRFVTLSTPELRLALPPIAMRVGCVRSNSSRSSIRRTSATSSAFPFLHRPLRWKRNPDNYSRSCIAVCLIQVSDGGSGECVGHPGGCRARAALSDQGPHRFRCHRCARVARSLMRAGCDSVLRVCVACRSTCSSLPS